MTLRDDEMDGFWGKLPLIRSLLLTQPEVELMWWMDSDAMFMDLAFELPWERYAPYNLVMHNWNKMVYHDRNWIGLNTNSFLLHNCQWSLNLLDAYPNNATGPATSRGGADRRDTPGAVGAVAPEGVALWMLDAVAEARGYNMRRARANLYRIVVALSWVADVVRWAEDTQAWRNPSATILAHGVLVLLGTTRCGTFKMEGKWRGALQYVMVVGLCCLLTVSAEQSLAIEDSGDSTSSREEYIQQNYLLKVAKFLWRADESSYHPVWPPLEFGWRIVLGTMIGFFGAAFGSVGGVGGGGIFVPMLTLIIGFDPKSSTAISKCMIMGAAASTVYFNLKLRHPTLDMPIIDYDLALLIQPMLMLGISIGVIFNVIFPDWMVTILLIVLFIGTSTKAFMKGVDAWKKETMLKKRPRLYVFTNSKSIIYTNSNMLDFMPPNQFPILQNVCWKELGLLVFVWLAFLLIQITKNNTATCSVWFWILNFLQIPISIAVTLYEAISLYKGDRVIASRGNEGSNWEASQLLVYCLSGIIAGIVGGLLGLGGGFILGPLFLELGIPPQVSSATATFAMTFSSSMSVIEYYLLNRFPVPYALYLIFVATVAAFVGQHVVKRLILLMGRASLIIFILASMIFISAVSLGKQMLSFDAVDDQLAETERIVLILTISCLLFFWCVLVLMNGSSSNELDTYEPDELGIASDTAGSGDESKPLHSLVPSSSSAPSPKRRWPN
ncbi:hypothetical protein Cni_G00114 [Canna indica]|uniref:Sulfite exporter TauE/SafE family protein n=1 Tax=Canna indica TaxID=4628 RepID=A0AAQ3JLR7_9LILI|nr:hypothetical protein Cni_G00114 [Canna indica]